jgi:phenylpropionate dioxygenase-like ring-hydroxylating dioxygenase large terminal subunit
MLKKEDNERICRVGPSTVMGNFMRQYWIPAMLSSELPAPDSDPLRILLLGERLIAFRDTNGRVGLLANNCPHRGASLFFGRNEECGLRCVYHGWKFDVSGQCVDMPNEPAESDFKTRVKAVAYPTHERGGIVFAYLGPRPKPPPVPDLEPLNLPVETLAVAAIQRECNWLQGLEGEIDTSHFGFLHYGAADAETAEPDSFQYYALRDRSPRYSVLDTEYGSMYAAYRPAMPGMVYWRIAHFLFPFWAMIPPGVLGLQKIARAWVPMDDEHTMFFTISPKPTVDPRHARPYPRRIPQVGPLLPNTTDWLGRFRLENNARNDYNVDRDMQRRREDFTGIRGIHDQDQAVTESMGPIYDRSSEHLGSSDAMVIRVRRRLLAAADDLAEHGTVPFSVDHPEVFRQRSGGTFLPEGADWIEATAELRTAYVEHDGLDPALARM